MTQLNFKNLLETETYLTVSEFTRDLKTLLETAFPGVWLQGEISNFTHHSSGHMYFSLKDENAQIPCVMWRSNNQQLFFTPQDGMRVLIKGRVSVYEKRGAYQLDIWQMQPAGVGELQLAFEQLKRKLRDEGLFSQELKQPIPAYPERIGIVTSPTGAAIRDLVTVLRRRFPPIEIILKPVRVQGENAALEITQAIDEFNEYNEVDVLIVGRGGGSIEDLWPFNEEMVARAIFRSKIPIISAVGHEIDFSISDFVADLRAPTPSAAAEIVVPDKEELQKTLQACANDMAASLLEKIKYERQKIKSIQHSYAFRQPHDRILQFQQGIDDSYHALHKSFTHSLQLNREKVSGLTKRLSLLEHKNVLKRGYSVCLRRSDLKVIKNANDLNEKDKIAVEFFQGKIHSVVSEVLN